MARVKSSKHDLDEPITQALFASLVGISEPAVSKLVHTGVLLHGDSGSTWLLAYCARLREQAAGRAGEDTSTDLAHERALLARSQREGQEIRNAVARGTYGPIGVLSDVLANASQSVVDRFDQIPAALRLACPELPPAAIEAVMRVLASSRNEMVRKTASLMADLLLDENDQPDEDSPADQADETD